MDVSPLDFAPHVVGLVGNASADARERLLENLKALFENGRRVEHRRGRAERDGRGERVIPGSAFSHCRSAVTDSRWAVSCVSAC